MSNIIRFTNPRRSREEMRRQASVWLARVDAGLSQGDRRALREWLDEHPHHAEVFMEMAALWDQLSILSGLSDMFPLDHYERPGRKKHRRRLLLGGMAAAASVAVLALPASRQLLDGWRAQPAAPTRVYETAIGEQSTINLPDNSVIVLNTDTLVEVRYSAEERQVLLRRGEALFTVEKDPTRPFRVHAGARLVEAVGTAFSVQHDAGADAVEVIVTEGKVSFVEDGAAGTSASRRPAATESGASLFLEAGDYLYSASRQSGAPPARVTMAPEDLQVRLAWSEGMLIFRDEPLADLLKEVQRYTTVRLRADPAILDTKVSAVYRPGDVQALLNGLRDGLQIDAVRVGSDLILLNRRP